MGTDEQKIVGKDDAGNQCFHMPNLKPHILGDFDDALNLLREQSLMMAACTERGLFHGRACLLKGDQSRGDIVITDDAEIDSLQDTILQVSMELLLRFHPVASDLRQVMASIRFSGLIRRVADEALAIAQHARPLCVDPPLAEVEWLRQPWLEAIALFSASIRAYASDVPLGHPTHDHEQKLESMNRQLSIQLGAAMEKRPDRYVGYTHLLFIRYHLEKVCEHSKKINEKANYLHIANDFRNANNPFTEFDSE